MKWLKNLWKTDKPYRILIYFILAASIVLQCYWWYHDGYLYTPWLIIGGLGACVFYTGLSWLFRNNA